MDSRGGGSQVQLVMHNTTGGTLPKGRGTPMVRQGAAGSTFATRCGATRRLQQANVH